jgi:hypothetical protein
MSCANRSSPSNVNAGTRRARAACAAFTCWMLLLNAAQAAQVLACKPLLSTGDVTIKRESPVLPFEWKLAVVADASHCAARSGMFEIDSSASRNTARWSSSSPSGFSGGKVSLKFLSSFRRMRRCSSIASASSPRAFAATFYLSDCGAGYRVLDYPSAFFFLTNSALRLSNSSILAPCLFMITLCWATESVLFQAQ